MAWLMLLFATIFIVTDTQYYVNGDGQSWHSGNHQTAKNDDETNEFIDGVANNVFHDIQKRLNGFDSDYDRTMNKQYRNSMCDFKISESVIIKTTESTDSGAEFLSYIPALLTKDECQIQCCLTAQCNLAVFKEAVQVGEDHACYLFDCGVPSVCSFSNHTGYVSMALEGGKLAKDQQEKHENDLALLAAKTTMAPTTTTTEATTTTTTSTTTTTPAYRAPVALFGDCQEHRDCAGSGTECLAGYCVCQNDYHAQDGLCRKDCTRFQFECANSGIPLAEPQCVAIYDKCDGTSQCQDDSDEENCDSTNAIQPHDSGAAAVPSSRLDYDSPPAYPNNVPQYPSYPNSYRGGAASNSNSLDYNNAVPNDWQQVPVAQPSRSHQGVVHSTANQQPAAPQYISNSPAVQTPPHTPPQSVPAHADMSSINSYQAPQQLIPENTNIVNQQPASNVVQQQPVNYPASNNVASNIDSNVVPQGGKLGPVQQAVNPQAVSTIKQAGNRPGNGNVNMQPPSSNNVQTGNIRVSGSGIIGGGTGVARGREQANGVAPQRNNQPHQNTIVDSQSIRPAAAAAPKSNIYSEGGGYYKAKPQVSPPQQQPVAQYPSASSGSYYGSKGYNVPSYGNAPSYNPGYGSNPAYDGQYYYDDTLANVQPSYNYEYVIPGQGRNNNKDPASGIPLQADKQQVQPQRQNSGPQGPIQAQGSAQGPSQMGGREQGSHGPANNIPAVQQPVVNGNQPVVNQPVESNPVESDTVQDAPNNPKPASAVDAFLAPSKDLNGTAGVVRVNIEDSPEVQVSLALQQEQSDSSHLAANFSSRGAVIALGLGLSVTALLLLFVGCRLRTVKTRLRRGRPLTTGEADYLINGMYL